MPGPATTKSLYITSKRRTAKPSARNLSSAALSWTKTTSASPRRPISSACPRTDRHHLHANAGLGRERGEDVPEQARLLRRGRGRHDDRSLLARPRPNGTRSAQHGGKKKQELAKSSRLFSLQPRGPRFYQAFKLSPSGLLRALLFSPLEGHSSRTFKPPQPPSRRRAATVSLARVTHQFALFCAQPRIVLAGGFAPVPAAACDSPAASAPHPGPVGQRHAAPRSRAPHRVAEQSRGTGNAPAGASMSAHVVDNAGFRASPNPSSRMRRACSRNSRPFGSAKPELAMRGGVASAAHHRPSRIAHGSPSALSPPAAG
jgi:hypothetical protein